MNVTSLFSFLNFGTAKKFHQKWVHFDKKQHNLMWEKQKHIADVVNVKKWHLKN